MSRVVNVTALIERIAGTSEHPLDRLVQPPALTVYDGYQGGVAGDRKRRKAAAETPRSARTGAEEQIVLHTPAPLV